MSPRFPPASARSRRAARPQLRPNRPEPSVTYYVTLSCEATRDAQRKCHVLRDTFPADFFLA